MRTAFCKYRLISPPIFFSPVIADFTPKQAVAHICSNCCCYVIFPSCCSLPCLKKLCLHHPSCALSGYFCLLMLFFLSISNLIPPHTKFQLLNSSQIVFHTLFGPNSGLGTTITAGNAISSWKFLDIVDIEEAVRGLYLQLLCLPA